MRPHPSRPFIAVFLAAACAAAAALAAPELPPPPADAPVPQARAAARYPSVQAYREWGHATTLVVGTLDRAEDQLHAIADRVNYILHVTVTETIRGPKTAGKQVQYRYSIADGVIGFDRSVPPEGSRVLLAVYPREFGNEPVTHVAVADDRMIAEAKLACELPMGWFVVDGKPRSPWAAHGGPAWPEGIAANASLARCAVTGRPAYPLGKGASLSIEPVDERRDPGTNHTLTEGGFRVTVSNPTKNPIEIPALRRVDSRILWEDCLVLMCGNRVFTVPGSIGIGVPTDPVTLEPGEKVSHVVNVLTLPDIEWLNVDPNPGFKFVPVSVGLGNAIATRMFGYHASYHEPIRQRLLNGVDPTP